MKLPVLFARNRKIQDIYIVSSFHASGVPLSVGRDVGICHNFKVPPLQQQNDRATLSLRNGRLYGMIPSELPFLGRRVRVCTLVIGNEKRGALGVSRHFRVGLHGTCLGT